MNDKLREALDLLNKINTMPLSDDDSGCIVQARVRLNEALAASKQEQSEYDRGWKDGYKHGAWASKQEPQAQAGEPEVHVTMDDAIAAGDGTLHGAIEYWQNQCAKKDPALDAAEKALNLTAGKMHTQPCHCQQCKAITQCKEARK